MIEILCNEYNRSRLFLHNFAYFFYKTIYSKSLNKFKIHHYQVNVLYISLCVNKSLKKQSFRGVDSSFNVKKDKKETTCLKELQTQF